MVKFSGVWLQAQSQKSLQVEKLFLSWQEANRALGSFPWNQGFLTLWFEQIATLQRAVASWWCWLRVWRKLPRKALVDMNSFWWKSSVSGVSSPLNWFRQCQRKYSCSGEEILPVLLEQKVVCLQTAQQCRRTMHCWHCRAAKMMG